MLRPTRYAKASDLIKYRALETASGCFGQEPVAAPVVVSFEATVNPAGVEQPACTLCGDCCSGCNVGAKNTVALTYLPDAKAHGSEIFTELTVSHVEKVDRHWRVHFAPTEDPDAPLRSVEAKTVVLSAGTLGSTEILLRSREEGLPVSDSLGQRFSANGDIIAFALGGEQRVNGIGVGHPPKFVGAAIGACVTGEIELHDNGRLDHSMFIQEGVLPSALAPLLPVFFISGGRLLGAAQSLIKGVYQGPFQNLYTFFVVSHDEAKGRIKLENGKAQIEWPNVAEQPVYARVDAALSQEAAEAVAPATRARSALPAWAPSLQRHTHSAAAAWEITPQAAWSITNAGSSIATAVCTRGSMSATAPSFRVRSASIRCSPSPRSPSAP